MPPRRTTRSSIASTVSSPAPVATTSTRKPAAKSATSKKRAPVIQSSDEEEEESDEVEEEADEEEDSEEEEEEAVPVPKAKSNGGRASRSTKTTDKPKSRGKKVSIVVPPSPEPIEEDEEEIEEEEEDAYDSEEEVKEKPNKSARPLKRTPTKPKSTKRLVVESPDNSDDEDDNTAVQSDANIEEEEDEEEDDAVADELIPKVEKLSIEEEGAETEEVEEEAEVAPATPEEVDIDLASLQLKEAVIPIPPPPPVNLAPTAFDLTAAARMAALNHAAREEEREKEREGKPRLVIHQMVLEDFKSYRGRGIIGPFHKSFSSIVGPNGSGKSNTIDALLFVFGYRATKMRQGKLSELIHNSGPAPLSAEETEAAELTAAASQANGNGNTNGNDEGDDGEFEEEEESDEEDYSKKKGKGKGKGKGKTKRKEIVDESGLIGSCTVEVWFREIIDLPGRDDFTVVPNSQLVVARTAYRNNSSKYTLNGRTSNFTEVTTLLKARGIDLDHKRFLILQGEVESIAQMKPKGATEHDEGLLEYLEDIIGTSKYKVTIAEALVEVDRLNDLRSEKMNRVKIVEREKSALEGRKKEADGYLRDQNELVHNKSALCQVNIHQSSLNAEIYRDAANNAAIELKAEIESQAGTRAEAEELQVEYDTVVTDLKAIEKATNEIVKELAVLDRSDVQLQEKRKHIVTKVKKLEKSITTDTHARSEAATWVKNHGDEIIKVRKDLDKMEATLEKEEVELEKVRDGLKGKTEVFSTQIESLQTDLQPWAEKIAEKQAAIDLAANERDLLVEKTESVKEALESAQASMEKLGNDKATKSAQLKELTRERKEIEAQVVSSQKIIERMQAEDLKLRTNATSARQKSDEAKASQAASKSQSSVLTSLTKLKDQGRLPGFHGRLGNLGRIDDKYDVAISTACGAGLDNLVTDTIAGGQLCIEHLRKNDLGRASVMCLDRINSRDMRPIQTPENAPRLFDLITMKDPKYASAFFQIIHNTLVAPDLEQANRIAFPTDPNAKRWRVVTLDGKVIDTSGTMSGGGGRPAKGGMSSKITNDDVSPEVVARCEKEREVAVEALRVFADERERVEKDLNQVKMRLPEIGLDMEKLEMELKTGGKRMEEAEKRFAELKSQSKPEAGDVKQIAQFEKDIGSLNKELDQLQQRSTKIEDQIKALQEKILEVGGVKLRSQQTKVQDLKAQIDHSSDRLTKAEVGQTKSEKDATKLSKTIESNEGILETSQAELAELAASIAKGAEDSESVRKGVEQAQEVLTDKREELKEMKEVLDEKLEIIIQFKARELELKQTHAAQQKNFDDATKAVTYWSNELGHLKLNDIDDDEDEEEVDPDAMEEDKAPRLDSELREFTPDEISELDVKVLKAKIATLEERIGKMHLDLAVLKEYARREREFMERAADLDLVTKERDGAKRQSDDLRNQRLREFMEGFGIISMKLKEMYQMITLGGNAELELVDSLDPFSEGIIFSVMPPKKSWKNISNLSGGEKTLSSLALVFALHVFKPTPLYFMDEIDAALDFRNVSIVANYIKDQTKNAQFIIISLRNNMFELSSRLVGVYKVNNATRSIAIDNHDIAGILTAA